MGRADRPQARRGVAGLRVHHRELVLIGPLLLQRGDPLPDLPLDGFDRERWNTGAWMLLVVLDPDREGEAIERITALAAAAPKSVHPVFLRVGEGPPHGNVIADPQGLGARRLGALVGADELHEIAVLVDPRGRVHRSLLREELGDLGGELFG